MPADLPITPIYWDTSAILSALIEDTHSAMAHEWLRAESVHLLSTLAWSESLSVLDRIWRLGAISESVIESLRHTLRRGPWQRLHLSPDWEVLEDLSGKWPLRGADLWHLATAKCLSTRLPELHLLTFDVQLQKAALGEQLLWRTNEPISD